MMTYVEKLRAAQQRNRSLLCIGLDIEVAKTPLPLLTDDEPMLPFARAIIEATQDLVCAYKVDLAYFLAEGAAGIVALERIVRVVPSDIPLIFDLGCAALGASAHAFAHAAFTQFKADAVVLWPQGRESVVDAFLQHKAPNHSARAVIVETPMEEPLYTLHWMTQWQRAYVPGTVSLAAHPARMSGMRALRSKLPNMPFFFRDVPEAIAEAVSIGKTKSGIGPIICAGQDIIYASRTVRFADEMRAAAQAMGTQFEVH
jgi:orotidine-5'-phosphate decarboxylase